MKIGHPADTSVTLAQATGQAAADTAKTQATPPAATPAKPDASAKVELSSTAATLLSTGAEFDAEKVARISKAIDDGSFKVNPEAIADKLIANAQELLSPKPR